jgi:hypothetical protein
MNTILKNEYKLTNDGDAWGNCMQWLFAICDYLTFETDECIPDEWKFRASPMGANEDCFCYQSLRHFAFEQEITDADVLEFGKVLIRLRDILERKGLSY